MASSDESDGPDWKADTQIQFTVGGGVDEDLHPKERIPKPSGWSLTDINARIARRLNKNAPPLTLLPDWWSTSNPDTPADLFTARTVTRAIIIGMVLAASLTSATLYAGVEPSLAGVAGGAALLTAFLSYTVYRFGSETIDSRTTANEIDSLLPDAVAFMYSQAEGSTNTYTIIAAMAEAEDAFGPVSREFQSITRRCEYFGTDLKQALTDQADTTPSDDLSRLFTDMIAFIESGGAITDFFDRETQQAFEQVENNQQERLDFIDLLSTMYIPFSIVPVLLVLIMAGVSSFRPVGSFPLILFGYIFAPLIPIAFILLANIVSPYNDTGTALSIRKTDREILSGTAYNSRGREPPADVEESASSQLRTRIGMFGGRERTTGPDQATPSTPLHPAQQSILKTDSASELSKESPVFDSAPMRERLYRLKSIVSDPIGFLTLRSEVVLLLSLPLALVALVAPIMMGVAPTPAVEAMINSPVINTTWWVLIPILVGATPATLFHELGRRDRLSIRASYPDTLQKISAANDTGMTLFESIQEATSDTKTQMNKELKIIEKKVSMAVPVEQALVEFANAHKDPQISRTTRLLIEAQRASERVSDVLGVAIKSATSREKMRERHASETKSYIAMISLTTLVVAVAAAILARTLIPLVSGDGVDAVAQGSAAAGGDAAAMDANILRTVLYHISFQYAFLGGLFAGFISTGELKSGLKFSLVGMVITTGIWLVVDGGLI